MSDLEQDDLVLDDSEDEDERPRRGRGPRRFTARRGGRMCGGRPNSKTCPFYKDGKCHISYLDVDMLRRYLTEEGKIRPRRQTKICSNAQRRLSRAVKRARHLALLPFTADHIKEQG